MEMTLKAGALLQGGKYKIIRVLGQGGFGITYEAEQVALKRTVAIKEFFMKDTCEREATTASVTVPTASNRELVAKFRRKFIREAQMIAAMRHPHIIRVLDVFEENDTAYYVMEYLPGGSLAGMVESSGRLSEEKALGYIREVADALSYIHAQNMLHLDVKPANILLDADGHAVLIDFGVSKHYDEAGMQTSSTPVAQSPGYAPIEQRKVGEVEKMFPATDIYALGATLYKLVTGKTPPDAEDVYEEDGIPRDASVSAALWNAIAQAMRPRRKDRPQSVEAFLALLPVKSKKSEETVISEGDVVVGKKPEKKAFYIAIAIASCLAVVAMIFGVSRCGGTTDQPTSNATRGYDNGHEWVDLGLPSGTLWATCNLGASSPEEYGDYYAWGEASAKSEYNWRTLKYCTGTRGRQFNKYVPSDKSNYWSGDGSPDNLINLDDDDDAAHVSWGGMWRIPTKDQWEELINECSWFWSGRGYTVTGPNGQSIVIPAAGSSATPNGERGYYWSSTLYTTDPDIALSVYLDSGSFNININDRYFGCTVRPVNTPIEELPISNQQEDLQEVQQEDRQETQQQSSVPTEGLDNGHEWVDLGLPSGTKWATCNVGASSPSENGNYYAWGETETKKEYSATTNIYCTDTWGNKFNKYVSSKDREGWSGGGNPDNKTRLDLSDDAARHNWKGNWRIPTREQWQELEHKCVWKWTGRGYLVTGPNGHSIFLPAAGGMPNSSWRDNYEWGGYWSSSLKADQSDLAWIISFIDTSKSLSGRPRIFGQSVRPVIEDVTNQTALDPRAVFSGAQESHTGYDNGHEWVDLDLPSGTKWATRNIGSTAPNEIGDYYAWAETRTKSYYSWEYYRFLKSGDEYDNVRFSKYNVLSGRGTVDSKTQLDPDDDAAYVKWGGNWRTPTKAQWDELEKNCDWSWTGSAYKVTGQNGQSIILPLVYDRYEGSSFSVGDYAIYGSSSLYREDPRYAWSLHFHHEDYYISSTSREMGLNIRPVTE